MRTLTLYPDAITRSGEATEADVLPWIDPSAPGCSVKDSFSCLDLSARGFSVLLQAQ